MSQDQEIVNAQFSIDMIFKDVIHFSKPKFRFADSYKTACKQLEKCFKDLVENSKEQFPKDFRANVTIDKFLNPTSVPRQVNGLDPIVEEEDGVEEQYMDFTGMEEDDMIDIDSNVDDEEIEYYCEDEETMENNDPDDMVCDRASESENENEEEPPNAPIVVKCKEDDIFLRDFEKILNDDLVSRSREGFRPNVEIAIPIERETEKKSKFHSPNLMSSFSMSLNDQNQDKSNPSTFNFRVMTRNAKSNKPILKSIEVSPNSDLVQNYLVREEARRAEKEAVKKLILDINERRELEDNGTNSSQANTSQNRFGLANNQSSSSSYRSVVSNSHNNYRKKF